MPTHPPAVMRQPVTAAAQLRRAGGSSPKRVGPHVTPGTLGMTSAQQHQLQVPAEWTPATRTSDLIGAYRRGRTLAHEMVNAATMELEARPKSRESAAVAKRWLTPIYLLVLANGIGGFVGHVGSSVMCMSESGGLSMERPYTVQRLRPLARGGG